MEKPLETAISPTRAENYSEWYQQVIRAADLAEMAEVVRGCMVIKPWGYALWENMQRVLDGMFKATGHQNAYFPLLIPISLFEKEAQHVAGFAKECAVVTHHRLEAGPDGKLVPASPLEEALVVRPTSETVIGAMFAKWVQSHRDLPLLINQWANVVRWELRPRLFLRTVEFLWQEGHTAHATAEEAQEETRRMLDVYADFAERYMAIPVIKGEKTESERFPGAVSTYCIEAMMQDRRALQAGTSHFLGQTFSRSSGIKFLDPRTRQEAYAWTTSWGVSTRLIGGLIMTHGDDDGLVLPPRLAPVHVAVLPVIHNEKARTDVLAYCEQLVRELRDVLYDGRPLSVELDTREGRRDKIWSWIKKGIPMYLEIGPREVASDTVFGGRRDRGPKERFNQARAAFIATVTTQLDEIQQEILKRACVFRDRHIVRIDSKEEFYEFFTPANHESSEIHGGFALCHWSGASEVEARVKNDLQVTIRCIPLDAPEEEGRCIISGQPSRRRVVFAKAY